MQKDYIIRMKVSGKYVNFSGVYPAAKGYTRAKVKERFKDKTRPWYPDAIFGLYERDIYTVPNQKRPWKYVTVLE